MNVPLPDLGDGRRLLCPLCFEAVEEASVERREFGHERTPLAVEDPGPSDAMTFETVEAVVLSPCGHATHRTGEERPDLFLPWGYEDPGMSDRFEDLQEYLSDLEQRFSEFDIGLYGQVGPLHDSQVTYPTPEERIYVRFAYEEWTVPEISDLPYEENPVRIPQLLDYYPVEDWTSAPWSGLDAGTTVRTVRHSDEWNRVHYGVLYEFVRETDRGVQIRRGNTDVYENMETGDRVIVQRKDTRKEWYSRENRREWPEQVERVQREGYVWHTDLRNPENPIPPFRGAIMGIGGGPGWSRVEGVNPPQEVR